MSNATGYPHCSLCETEHPLGGPHAWDKPATIKPKKSPAADARLDGVAARVAAARVTPVMDQSKRRGRPATGFDKKAYQRDLMRKRRAKT